MNSARGIAPLATWSLLLMAMLWPASIAHTASFSIYWTAPGDDNMIGRSSVYDLRYSNLPITAANFNLATPIPGLPLPAVAGTLESFVVSGLSDGAFYMAIRSADEIGNWSTISNVLARPGQTTGVDLPSLALAFSSPWPNPARESVRWAYSLPRASQVQVDVFDVTGRHVHTVASGGRGAGKGEWTWDLRDDRGQSISGGVYLVKARIADMEWTKRLIVVR